MAEMTLTSGNFKEEIEKASVPVIVDFWADWCGPCKMLAPILEEFAEENEEKIIIGKVNVDEERGLAVEFNVASIPTVVLFKDGEAVDRLVGLHSKEDLEEFAFQ